jgi:hypothetical protein
MLSCQIVQDIAVAGFADIKLAYIPGVSYLGKPSIAHTATYGGYLGDEDFLAQLRPGSGAAAPDAG